MNPLPWTAPAPVCSQCDRRCDADPDLHEPLTNGYLGRCNDCTCPNFHPEGDR